MVREVRRRQHDLVAGADESRQRGRERMIGSGGDQQIVWPTIDPDMFAEALRQHAAQ